MVNYQNGQIYKLWSPLGDLIYIGSTVQSLCNRIARHRGNYRYDKMKTSAKILFDEYGVENVKIELIKKFPCDSKTELLQKEGQYIRSNKNCVNKCIAGRSKKQYNIDNREKIAKYSKEYLEKNKTTVYKKHKLYRERCKEEIYARRKIKIECECGAVICRKNLSVHKKTKKHQNYLKSL